MERMIPYMANFFNPTDLVTHGVMFGILGFLIKRWMNGTANDIALLKKDKVDHDIWRLGHEQVVKDISSIQCDVGKINSTLGEIRIAIAANNMFNSFQHDVQTLIKSNALLLRERGESEQKL